MTHFLTVFAREAKRRSNLPGGWRSAKYKFRTFSVGYFADAQYDALGLGDCRGTSCLAMTTEKRFSLSLDMTYLFASSFGGSGTKCR